MTWQDVHYTDKAPSWSHINAYAGITPSFYEGFGTYEQFILFIDA